MHTTVIIPARHGSSRFPGKPLAILRGKPVLQHVFDNARSAREVDRVIIATDHEAIYSAARAFGAEVEMTSSDLPSGTDRVAAVAKKIQTDIIVNVQGDEPLLAPEMIDSAAALLKTSPSDIGTLATRIVNMDDIFNPNIVKVVTGTDGNALYFSRAPIPFYRDVFTTGAGAFSLKGQAPAVLVFKHIGIYSYRRDVLLDLTSLPPSRLEEAEKLEQLRALENGFRIRVGMTEQDTIGVDTPEDIGKVEQWLNSYS